MINRIFTFLLLLIYSSQCIALPLTSMTPSSGGGSLLIIAFLVGPLAFYLYYKMFTEWLNRKKNKIKTDFRFNIRECLITILFFAMLSLFASSLIFVVLDFIGGQQLVRSIGLYVWFTLFVFLIFLAITG